MEQVWKYPTIRRDESVVEDLHGTKVADPYRWLEDPDSEETKKWSEEQNKLTSEVFKQFTKRDTILSKLKDMQNYPKYSCPFKRGTHYFFWKNDGLQNQNVLYIQDSLEAEPRVFLDPNKLNEDGTSSIGTYAFSESGDYMAYAVHESGSDWKSVHVKKVPSGENLADKVEWVKFSSLAWKHDGSGFYYCRYAKPSSLKDDGKKGTETESAKNQKVYFHKLNTDQSEDELIYSDPEHPSWMFGVEVSDDGQYLIITVSESCERVNRFFYVDLTKPIQKNENGYEVTRMIDNFEAMYEYVTNEGTKFYLQTNLKAPKNKIIQIDINDPQNHVEIIPESRNVMSWITPVNDKFVLSYMEDVKETLQLFDFNGKHLKDFSLPTLGTISGISGKKKHTELFYSFVSFLHPGTIFHYDFQTDQTKTFREIKIQNLDPTLFETKQIFYKSLDGTKIPMFLIHRKDIELNGKNPALLYGYGGFNISLTPVFSVSRVIWMTNYRGILAVPNLRGGNEYGEEWHKGGILEKKQNVFDDFKSAAQTLFDMKYTSPEHIAIMGGSNGGLLVSACVNQNPEMFACGISQVPVTDMLRFHKFTIGHAWISDYGTADKPEDFEYLIKYSPLHTIKKGKPFPAVLVTTADHDDRVVPLHSFKYVSELQYQLGNEPYQKNPLIVRVDIKAGHGHGKPITKILEEFADIYSFIAFYTKAVWHDV